jgi:hypothetical protein
MRPHAAGFQNRNPGLAPQNRGYPQGFWPADKVAATGGRDADPETGSLQSFVDATARATGKARSTVSVDAERGKKITGVYSQREHCH